MTAVICPKCGTENSRSVKECQNCGIILALALKHAAQDEASRQKWAKILKFIGDSIILQIVIGFFGCLIILAFWEFFSKIDNDNPAVILLITPYIGYLCWGVPLFFAILLPYLSINIPLRTRNASITKFGVPLGILLAVVINNVFEPDWVKIIENLLP